MEPIFLDCKEALVDRIKSFKYSLFPQSSEREEGSVLFYLYSISQNSSSVFPCTVEFAGNGPPPDCKISLPNKVTIQIEHTLATHNDFQAKKSNNKKYNGGYLLTENFAPAILPVQKGFINNNVTIMRWIEHIVQAIRHKATIYEKSGNKNAIDWDLLVEDHTPDYPLIDIRQGISNLREIRNLIPAIYTFRKVHIFSIDDFVYDVFGEMQLYKFPVSE